MPKKSKFTGINIPTIDTKHYNTPMPVGRMPFGGFDANKKANNNVFGNINSDLIGRVVRDEKKDDNGQEKKDNNEEKTVDTSITDNSTNSSNTIPSSASGKNNKNDDENTTKELIELAKLRLLSEMSKDKKTDTKGNKNDSKFEDDYHDMRQGNRLADIHGLQRFINEDNTKHFEKIQQMDLLLTKQNDNIINYNNKEEDLKNKFEQEYKEEGDTIVKEGSVGLKVGIKVAIFNLDDDLKGLIKNFINRLSYSRIDDEKEKQLTLSKEDMYAIAQEIANLENKLNTEINTRMSNGIKLDQSSINLRKSIRDKLYGLIYTCDLLGVDDVRHAIEEDCEKMSEIYNGLNIFQRFWYALMDLIFGTNYNQEYNDIISIQRLMIRELNLSNDELNPEKHYKHILKFCDLSNKLNNVRENMATFMLYPEKRIASKVKEFKEDALKPKRSADGIFTELFKICGGKLMSQYISNNKKDEKIQRMQKLLVDSVQIEGLSPTASQKKKIIDLALSGKSGEDINNELGLIDDDDDEKDSKIQNLNKSVSSGELGSFKELTDAAIKEKTGLWRAKFTGKLCEIACKYAKQQTENFDKLLNDTEMFFDTLTKANLANLIKTEMSEDQTGIKKGSQQIVKLEKHIITSIKQAHKELLKMAEKKFNVDDSKDDLYDDAYRINKQELEKISSDKLTEEDKKAGKKPNTSIEKLKVDKYEETNMLKNFLYQMTKSPNKIKKEYYDKIKEEIDEKFNGLINGVKETFEEFNKQKPELINEWEAHSQNNTMHLDTYKSVENTKSKYGGRYYKDMKEVAQSKGGRGGGSGMGMFGGW